MSSRNGKYVLASAIVLALCVTPIALGAGEGSPIRGGARNPSNNETQNYTRETQIIANVGGYGTRQSNKSTGGGGAIYGCRANQQATNTCIRASNLSSGQAFSFSSGGPVVGRIEADNATSKPLTTNATGVADGFNADRVDGKNADDIVNDARALTKFAKVDGASGGLTANRGATASTREGLGQYAVTFGSDVSACAYTATVIGGDAALGFASVESVSTTILRVRTRAAAGDNPAADRSFHLVVNC